jgi:hypothetical protein
MVSFRGHAKRRQKTHHYHPVIPSHPVVIEKNGVPVSPFHDIPLFANEEKTILNMVVEIPRWSNAKLEVSRRGWCPDLNSNMMDPNKTRECKQ